MQQININKEVLIKLSPMDLKIVIDHLHNGIHKVIIGTLVSIEQQVSEQIKIAERDNHKILTNEQNS